MNLFTVTQAAALASCNRSYIKAEITAGRLPAKKIGTQWLITREAFTAWMANPRRGSRLRFAKQIVRGSFQPYGNGWTWQIVDDEGKISTYRTNENGGGLWQCGTHTGVWAHNHEDKQITGTSQFSLPSLKESARRAVKRYFEI